MKNKKKFKLRNKNLGEKKNCILFTQRSGKNYYFVLKILLFDIFTNIYIFSQKNLKIFLKKFSIQSIKQLNCSNEVK